MDAGDPLMSILPSRGPVRAVVLVLHGGAETGLGRVRPWGPAYLRMLPMARAVHRATAWHGVEVRLLRNRVRGWNEPELHPVADARWALERVTKERPGVPVLLVGHSMGGRVALRVADDPAVTAVCALAPWTPDAEPVEPVRGRDVVIAHGVWDRITRPAESYTYARRAGYEGARVVRFEVMGEGHAMLRRPGVWNRIVRSFTLDAAGIEAATAWETDPGRRLRLPL
ncbi:alpha/beta hydrolase [Amycolatopsis pigmentata]|uniref:Alpha/beta hydrolase n=1 Tax=Amycolatopsis pigmentata TaxID=450801 RepID=A0ABW5FQR2_9PSEU